MARGEPVAIGWSVHTGWAACVVAGGSLRAPRVVAREVMELREDPARFVFHRAAEMTGAAAAESVARATQEVTERAKGEIDRVARRAREAGNEVIAGAIVAKTGAMRGSLAEILAAHPRIHTAEGCLYRDAIAAAAGALGIATRVIAPKELEARAAKATGVGAGEIARLLAAAGKIAGAPWAKDQKEAALAAWIALAE